MKDRIEIERNLIPYNFDIVLAGENFNLEFFYNAVGDFYTVTLRKEDEVLVYNEPIIYGVELFKNVYIADKFPRLAIIPMDESGEKRVANKATFNSTVFLTIDNDTGEEQVMQT